VPDHKTLIALTAAALTLAAASTASAKPPAASPCRAPAAGFQSCLRVLYKAAPDGSVSDVRVTATVVRRFASCPAAAGRRRVVITRDADGSRLGSARRPGRCHNGVVTWRTTFSAGETAGWALEQGDTIDAAWSGVRNTASVKLTAG
jgi:hypothetical protein